jgi:hypothetical protein
MSGIILKAVFQLHMLNNCLKKQKYVISKANFDFVLDFKTKRKHKIEHFPLKLTKWIGTPGCYWRKLCKSISQSGAVQPLYKARDSPRRHQSDLSFLGSSVRQIAAPWTGLQFKVCANNDLILNDLVSQTFNCMTDFASSRTHSGTRDLIIDF